MNAGFPYYCWEVRMEGGFGMGGPPEQARDGAGCWCPQALFLPPAACNPETLLPTTTNQQPGTSLARLPVDPMLGRVLLAAAELKCMEEALAVVAMTSTDPVFQLPRQAEGGGGVVEGVGRRRRDWSVNPPPPTRHPVARNTNPASMRVGAGTSGRRLPRHMHGSPRGTATTSPRSPSSAGS